MLNTFRLKIRLSMFIQQEVLAGRLSTGTCASTCKPTTDFDHVEDEQVR